jgi:hypothetical protein
MRDPKIVLSTKHDTTADLLEEIFNAPTVIKYKYKGEAKSCEISRISILSVEKAARAFIKIVKLFREAGGIGNNKFDAVELGNIIMNCLADPEESKDIKNILFSCLTITPEEFSTFPPSFAVRILTEWVAINQSEIAEFYNRFLALKGTLLEMKETLSKSLQKKE